MTMRICYVWALLTITRHVSSLSQSDLSATKFSSFLQTMIDDTGFNYVQKKYDENPYNVEPLNGNDLTNELTTTVNSKFRSSIAAVSALRDKVVQQYGALALYPTMTQCCQLSDNLEIDPRLQVKVGTQNMCVHKSGNAASNAKYISNEILDLMKKNYADHPNVKWQYFGTEDGLYYNYPAYKFDSCTEYDHRYRPWYVEAATPMAKDVVIVIDRSGSMGSTHQGKTLMNIAIEAAKSVIGTVNPRDRVAVVTFSNAASTPPGNSDSGTCFSSQLAKGTPQNIRYLQSFLDGVSYGGGTSYVAGINKAFRFFSQSDISPESTEKVILFMTDGRPKEKQPEIENAIRTNNAQFNNKVIIFTYGLGSGLDADANNILLEMTKLGATTGKFTKVSDPSKLRTDMSSYYDFFSVKTENNDVIISIPYIDAFSKALITSIVFPVHYGGNLVGVIGVDLAMSELLSDITYFRQGEFSYAFMADGNGRAMMHPYLPQPFAVHEPPIFVDISTLEPQATSVIDSMKSGLSGTMALSRRMSLSRGNTDVQGVNEVLHQVTYHWNPVSETNFSVCVVIAANDRQGNLPSLTLDKKFVYHDLKLQNTASKCKFFKRLASISSSSIKFSPYAFKEPFEYLSGKESKNDVDGYSLYLKGQTPQNPGLKPNVRSAVALTATVEDFWLHNKTSNSDFLVWRYFGSIEGVMRSYPATTLAKSYDHAIRPWYKRTVARRGMNVVSAPYLDGWGAGFIITLSRTVAQGAVVHTPDDLVAGVIGTDFTIGSFYNKVIESNDACGQSEVICFVIDDSGFIVMHPDFVDTDEKDLIQGVHVVEKLPSITKELIDSGLLKREACINYETAKYNTYWRVTLKGRHTGNSFTLEEVSNSNLYIGAYSTSKDLRDGRCRCEKTYSKCVAGRQDRKACECPCHQSADFNYCENKVPVTSDSWPACTPRVPESAFSVKSEENDLTNLQRCIDKKCHEKKEKTECFGVSGCNWCRTISSCYYADEHCPTGDGLSSGAIAGIVVGVIAVLIIIAVICYCMCKGSGKNSPSTASPSHTHENPQQASHGYDNPQPVTDTAYAQPSAPPAAYGQAPGHSYHQQKIPPVNYIPNQDAVSFPAYQAPPMDLPPPYQPQATYDAQAYNKH